MEPVRPYSVSLATRSLFETGDFNKSQHRPKISSCAMTAFGATSAKTVAPGRNRHRLYRAFRCDQLALLLSISMDRSMESSDAD